MQLIYIKQAVNCIFSTFIFLTDDSPHVYIYSAFKIRVDMKRLHCVNNVMK